MSKHSKLETMIIYAIMDVASRRSNLDKFAFSLSVDVCTTADITHYRLQSLSKTNKADWIFVQQDLIYRLKSFSHARKILGGNYWLRDRLHYLSNQSLETSVLTRDVSPMGL